MLLSQISQPDGRIGVALREGSEAALVKGASSTYALAKIAASSKRSLAEVIAEHGLGDAVDPPRMADEGRVMLPITHPDPTHMHLTGTGLTHLGSASTRNAMHSALQSETPSDSMKMFAWA